MIVFPLKEPFLGRKYWTQNTASLRSTPRCRFTIQEFCYQTDQPAFPSSVATPCIFIRLASQASVSHNFSLSTRWNDVYRLWKLIYLLLSATYSRYNKHKRYSQAAPLELFRSHPPPPQTHSFPDSHQNLRQSHLHSKFNLKFLFPFPTRSPTPLHIFCQNSQKDGMRRQSAENNNPSCVQFQFHPKLTRIVVMTVQPSSSSSHFVH